MFGAPPRRNVAAINAEAQSQAKGITGSSVTWSTAIGANRAIDPCHFASHSLLCQVTSALAIEINDVVQLPNEPEKSSIAVLSPRLL
jgi:hypothetical protein